MLGIGLWPFCQKVTATDNGRLRLSCTLSRKGTVSFRPQIRRWKVEGRGKLLAQTR
jgi:hypothetical protein